MRAVFSSSQLVFYYFCRFLNTVLYGNKVHRERTRKKCTELKAEGFCRVNEFMKMEAEQARVKKVQEIVYQAS